MRMSIAANWDNILNILLIPSGFLITLIHLTFMELGVELLSLSSQPVSTILKTKSGLSKNLALLHTF